MDELVTMSAVMTGSIAHDDIFQAKDDGNNRFIHIAVKKADVPTVEWIYNTIKTKYALSPNKNYLRPLDLCIQQLAPTNDTSSVDKDSDIIKILHATITYMASKHSNNAIKKECLTKIIALQLAHKQHISELPLAPDALDCLIPSTNIPQKESYLASFYQQACDTATGNTFTHVLVQNESADELFDWLTKGLVSFEKNKEGLTALDIALNNFRFFTQNVANMETYKSSFERRKCCLFMLLNYLKNKNNETNSGSLENCCSKHIVAQ